MKIFGSSKPFEVLLRPDRKIALLAPDCSLDEIEAYFKRVIGRL